MKLKISLLWLFLAVGFILHHIYGLFGVYYHESLMMEGATGEVPLIHHIYRILFEGIALIFCLLSLEITAKLYKWVAFVWAILLGGYNVYHLVASFMYEASNISEILILGWMVAVSALLILNGYKWIKNGQE
ncbi:hypothetical protein HN014_13765 [Aquimarina sp. TRL1]|uniref:hypothetical protein n=1 Tax=Aquimarina sp. (strain TRL1) TaxID=2736252 RepID=UPI00158D34C5|nr:hypothetical protein [Aquimarina sp. TRL1]QKX05927.1 hypothetical protein HN014_13765 [Aquimarina sp. TRL1]